jgi:hypothetical protein
MAPDLAQRKRHREIDRLITRVLQLDDLLHHDATFDAERAAALQEQIKKKQARLSALYDEIA